MKPLEIFKFCPRCGAQALDLVKSSAFRCKACQFLYHFNPATSVAAFLMAPDGTALFIRRAIEPAKGKLALPGGFVDFGESAEDALRREVREEVNLAVKSLDYLGSTTNNYFYEEVTYSVLDLYFIATPENDPRPEALDGVESFAWLDPRQVNPQDVAFVSIQAILKVFLKRFSKR